MYSSLKLAIRSAFVLFLLCVVFFQTGNKENFAMTMSVLLDFVPVSISVGVFMLGCERRTAVMTRYISNVIQNLGSVLWS